MQPHSLLVNLTEIFTAKTFDQDDKLFPNMSTK